MKTTRTTMTMLLAAAAMATLAGCQPRNTTAAPADDFFAASEESTRTADVLAAQSGSGARADGMLYAAHFAGPALNSLGLAKLDRMLNDDDPCAPLTVYLSMADNDARTAPRKAAVTNYLKDRGLKADQIKLVMGDNPAASYPAAPLLQRMDRTESAPGAVSGGTTPTGSTSSGPTQTSTESATLIGGG